MNKYITLTKILLRNRSNSTIDRRKKIKIAAISTVIILALLPSIIMFINFILQIYDLLYRINQQGLILSIGISFASILIFFFGIFYSLNVLYFTKDIDNLLPLPLRPWEILGAKFTVALIYEYITEAFILLPIFGVFAFKSGAGLLYYIYGIIIFITLPITPLGISAFLNMIIMSFSNIGKHKDKLKIIGGIFGMALGVSFNIGMQKIGMSTAHPDMLIKMLQEGNNSLVTISNKVFPGSSIAAKAMILNNKFEGLTYMMMFLILTLVVLLIFLILGEKLYFKGVVGISETSSKRRKLNSRELNRLLTKKSPLKALVIKEIKILVRTPVYFMNCIIMNFLWPIFILIPIFTQPELFKDIKRFSGFLRDPKLIGVIIGISAAISIFISASNAITSTAISREGQNLFISKYIPISYATQLIAKVLTGAIIGLVAIIMMILVANLLISTPAYLTLLVLIASLPGIIFSCALGILIDLNFPKLNWDNEVKAVKQNFNVMICLLFSVVAAAAIAFLTIYFSKNALWISIAVLIFLSIVDCILYKVIVTKGVSLFKALEG